MGVNRAYPYAKIEKSELGEHIDTMYKLVHVCSFNIGLQTLSLLYQIVGHSNDRSVLLSKSQTFYLKLKLTTCLIKAFGNYSKI